MTTKFETVYDIISAHNEMKAIVPIELTQIGYDVIVSFEMTQIPNVLFATGWSNQRGTFVRLNEKEAVDIR